MDSPPQRIKFQKLSLLFLKILGGIILFILIAGVIITAIFGNDVKKAVVNEINKQLTTEVKVNGEIEFSVFQNFPYISVIFNDVEIKEGVPGSKNNLLKTEKVTLLFNVIDLWRKNLKIKRIIVGKGDLNVVVDDKGEPNFNIFKSGSSTDTSKFSFSIDKIELSELTAQYTNNQANQLYQFLFHKATLSGNFSSSEFSLKLNSSFLCNHLFVSSKDYLTAKEVELTSDFEINKDKELYEIKNAYLSVEKVPFKINGLVQNKPNTVFVDFSFTGNKVGIESLTSILPNDYGKYLKEYHSKGTVAFKGTIKGDVSPKSNPEINALFSIKKGSISNDKISTTFDNVNLEAVYSNGKNRNLRSSIITISNASTVLKGRSLNFSLELRDFVVPYVSFKVNTTVDLKEIFPLLHLQDVSDMSGELTLNNCYYSGYASQLNASINLNTTQSGGEITISNGAIVSKRANLQNINGTFALERNLLSINKFSLTSGNSDLNVSGTVADLIPYLLAVSADSTKRLPVSIDLTVNSNRLNWEELLKPQPKVQTNASPSVNVIPETFDILNGKVSVNVSHFTFQKFKGDNIHGVIIFTPTAIYFNEITLSAEGGNVTANGELNKADKNALRLTSSYTLNNIDISRLFYECENWGQSVITNKNLKGILNTSFVLNAGWNKSTFDPNQLVVIGDISIDKGELNNFAPMRALSKFVKIKELENVRFEKIQNQIDIRNSVIHIPTMDVSTNSLSLELSGNHTFDNIIDYRIKLNLLQLLTNKLKASRSFDADATEKTPNGLLNLYITMQGPANNPVIKYDRKTVKEKIKKDMATEKQTLKQTLQKEFSKQQQQQSQVKDWKAPPEYEYVQFGDTTDNDADNTNNSKQSSLTRQKQKNAFDNFKKSLQKNKNNPPQ